MVRLPQRALAASTRPDVPIVLVCTDRAHSRGDHPQRSHPLYAGVPDRESGDEGCRRLRRRNVQRADAQLPANLSSLRESRRLVREWLTVWSRPALIPVALVVVNVFVENVLEHTGAPGDADRDATA